MLFPHLLDFFPNIFAPDFHVDYLLLDFNLSFTVVKEGLLNSVYSTFTHCLGEPAHSQALSEHFLVLDIT